MEDQSRVFGSPKLQASGDDLHAMVLIAARRDHDVVAVAPPSSTNIKINSATRNVDRLFELIAGWALEVD